MTSFGKDIFCEKINGKDPHDVGNATLDSVLGNGNTSSSNLIINGTGEINVNYALTAKANTTQADAELSFYDAALTKRQEKIAGTPLVDTNLAGTAATDVAFSTAQSTQLKAIVTAVNEIQTKLAAIGIVKAS